MASLTISQARAQLTAAASAFVASSVRPAITTNSSPSPVERDVSAYSAAQVIRAADAVLAILASRSPEELASEADIIALTQALRHAAHLVIAARNPDQAWYWTPEWQAGEREADEDKAAGRITFHDSDDAFEAALKARRPDVADASTTQG